MAKIVNKNELIKFMGDHYERNFKTANYLLLAHGGSLASCATLLKDYASTPQLKGISILIAIFAVGLLASLIYYASLLLARAVVLNALQSDEDPNDSPSAGFLKVTNVASLVVAVVALIASIGLVVWKAAFL